MIGRSRDLGIQIVSDSTQALASVMRIERGLASMGSVATDTATKVGAANAKIDASLQTTSAAAVATSRAQEVATAGLVAASAKGNKEIQSHFAATTASMKRTGDSLKGLSLPIAAIGGGAAKMAIDFSRAMEVVHTQAGYSQATVDSLSKSVLALAPQVGVGPVELAKGLFHIASAGIPASQAMGVLEEAAKGAAIGGTDLEGVTNALVGVLKSAPKDIHGTADAMGLLNSIVGQGNMHMADLVTALGTGVVPAAKGAGLGLRDLGAAIDVLTDRGVPAVDAATQLKMSFAQMERETPTATKALASIGIGSGQLASDLRKPNGLLRAVDDLKMHLEASGKTATEQNATILAVFGRRSAAAMQSLVQNAAALADKQKGLPGATEGVTKLQKAFADWEKTPAAQWEKNLAGLKSAGIELGNNVLPVLLPLVKDIAVGIGDAAKAFEKLPKPVRDGAVALAALVAVAGPALIFTSKMASAFGALGGLVKAGLVKMGVIATGEAAVEGTAAGVSYSAAFDAAVAEGITAGAAEGGAIMAAIVAAGPVLAAALAVYFGQKLIQNLVPSITGGGLTAPPGEGIGGGKTAPGWFPGSKNTAPSSSFGAGFLPAGAKYVSGRIDQGKDFTTNPGGAIIAPGAGRVVAVKNDPSGFGPDYPVVHFTSGAFAGKDVYIGHTDAALKAGDTFTAGQTIANTSRTGHNAPPGWAEIGFASALGQGIHNQGAAIAPYFGGAGGKTGLIPGTNLSASVLAGVGGASLKPCLLTYYDPRKGGINVYDPKHPFDLANGGTWTPSMMGCAAPPSYKFGTLIEFHWKGKSVVCTVVDRGGAIQGNHFDLQPAPAQKLGMTSAGKVTGQFRVVSAGSGVTSPGADTSAKQQSADFAQYQQATSDVQLQGQAGLLTNRQVDSQIRAIGARALAGGFGSLDSHMILQVKADVHAAAPSGSDALYGLESKSDRATLSTQRALAKGAAGTLAGLSGPLSTYMANQTRLESIQNLTPVDLSTAKGTARAIGDLRERKGAQEHIKAIYQDELNAMKKEIAAWAKSRDTYRKLARKATGSAKVQALARAAGLQKMIDQAQTDASAMGDNIANTDVEIQSLSDQITQTGIDATNQQQSQDFSNYQQANSDIDQQVAAGLMTQAQGDAQKTANAQSALQGGYGALSQRDTWTVMADLKTATQANTTAIDANTQAQLDATTAMLQFTQAAMAIQAVETQVAIKALADVISGQIVGVDLAGRSGTAGSGAAARY